MPSLNGIETIQRIRNQLNLSTTIFACTSDVFKEAHDRLLDAGANFVLTKPLQSNSLIKVLEQFSDKCKNSELTDTTMNNVVELVRFPINKLSMTEEEVSTSPLLHDMGFSEAEKNNLLTSLCLELEAKSVRLIEAFAQSDTTEMHKVLHSIAGMTVEFRMTEMASLAKVAEESVRKGQIPDPELLQKLVNLMNVNCHQTHRLLSTLNSRKENQSKLDTKRILVAEDNNVNLIVITKLLESMGFKDIDVAKNGEEAVNYAKQHSYYVILMDNHMPVMTGIEASKIIKNQISPSADIIACTADATVETKQEFMLSGVSEVILKPIDREKLTKALSTITEKDNISAYKNIG